MAERQICSGALVQVLINGDVVGLATNAAYDEDWAVTPAKVLGVLGALDWDCQDYSCTVTLGTFVPMRPDMGPWPDGGTKSLYDLLPTRTEIQGNVGKPSEFDLMQFMNIGTGEIVCQFRQVMLASNGVQISSNSYVTANVRFMARERTN